MGRYRRLWFRRGLVNGHLATQREQHRHTLLRYLTAPLSADPNEENTQMSDNEPALQKGDDSRTYGVELYHSIWMIWSEL